MRSTSLLLSCFVAACTSSGTSGTSGSPELVPEAPDRVDTLTCPAPISNCGSCDQTLTAALQDQRLCGPGFPASVEVCGDHEVVRKSEIDTRISYYYRDGQLAAMVGDGPNNHFGCMAGPQTLEIPHCSGEHAIVLPACSATHGSAPGQ